MTIEKDNGVLGFQERSRDFLGKVLDLVRAHLKLGIWAWQAPIRARQQRRLDQLSQASLPYSYIIN